MQERKHPDKQSIHCHGLGEEVEIAQQQIIAGDGGRCTPRGTRRLLERQQAVPAENQRRRDSRKCGREPYARPIGRGEGGVAVEMRGSPAGQPGEETQGCRWIGYTDLRGVRKHGRDEQLQAPAKVLESGRTLRCPSGATGP